mmetsp:Transcript_42100/g.88434  ORF Transcript_42100/g.88434 Transcript_42100/m.88434 type:complete len:135 (-) Transcript_42100:7-411(-)
MSTTKEDYVRVKRRSQTFFIHTSPSDTFVSIKDEISLAMGGRPSPSKMRLYIPTSAPNNQTSNSDDKEMGEAAAASAAAMLPKDPIPDTAILSDHNVTNDDVLYVTFVKSWESSGDDEEPEGEDAWEEIEIVKP